MSGFAPISAPRSPRIFPDKPRDAASGEPQGASASRSAAGAGTDTLQTSTSPKSHPLNAMAFAMEVERLPVRARSEADAPPRVPRWNRCVSAMQHALGAVRGLGARALGLWVGLWLRMTQRGNFGESLSAAALAGAGAPYHPLQELFFWTQQTRDLKNFVAWLRLNGLPDGEPQDVSGRMDQVALEVVELRRGPVPVVLQDHNVPLLHPFAHDDAEIFNAYVERMQRPGSFASGPEAQALAAELGVRIAVYQRVDHEDAPSTTELRELHGAQDAPGLLCIRHDNRAHWETVQRAPGTDPDEAFGEDDRILSTQGGGNCLFHAVAQALRINGDARGQELTHLALREMAIRHMRGKPGTFASAVRLDVDVARAHLQPDREDVVDAAAVQAVRRAQLHQPWDVTWAYLAGRVADVQNFNGASGPNATVHAMNRLMDNLFERMQQARDADLLTADRFMQTLTEIATTAGTGVPRLLGALSAHQRAGLLRVFNTAGAPTLSFEAAEAAFGFMFNALAWRDRVGTVGMQQLGRQIARDLQDPMRLEDCAETLTQEIRGTRHHLLRKHPLSPTQWRELAANPLVRAAAARAIADLALAQTFQPGNISALYHLVAAAGASARDELIQALLRESPAVFARLGMALNRRIAGTEPSDLAERNANQAAIDALFHKLAAI